MTRISLYERIPNLKKDTNGMYVRISESVALIERLITPLHVQLPVKVSPILT